MSMFALVDQEDPISPLCRMVVETKYEDLPDPVIDRAKRSIMDTMAVTIGGSALEGIQEMVAFVKEKGGKPESLIPFYGGKVPASEAGMAIGPMSRAMDLGDFYQEAGHCTEYIFPAMLAATGLKSKITGKEFITALVLGQEVLLRIGEGFNFKKSGTKDRHSGHFIFGTVAAVGKLLSLSLDELENAQGMASEMTQPHSLALYNQEATLIVRVHHGFICQDAINVCLLATRGITGPRQDVLAAPVGYLGFAKWDTNPEALLSGLGEKWETENILMKHYPAVVYSQTAIEGVLDQMKKYHFKANDIASIVIVEAPYGQALARRTPPWNPQTVHECQFSLPYLVATAAYDGDISLDSYTPQAMARQSVRDLMSRITGSEDPNLPSRAVRMNTVLNNGTKYSDEYIYSKGHPKNPFTDQELINKFKMCTRYSACKMTDTVVESLIDTILNLEKVDDVVNALLRPLTPG